MSANIVDALSPVASQAPALRPGDPVPVEPVPGVVSKAVAKAQAELAELEQAHADARRAAYDAAQSIKDSSSTEDRDAAAKLASDRDELAIAVGGMRRDVLAMLIADVGTYERAKAQAQAADEIALRCAADLVDAIAAADRARLAVPWARMIADGRKPPKRALAIPTDILKRNGGKMTIDEVAFSVQEALAKLVESYDVADA